MSPRSPLERMALDGWEADNGKDVQQSDVGKETGLYWKSTSPTSISGRGSDFHIELLLQQQLDGILLRWIVGKEIRESRYPATR